LASRSARYVYTILGISLWLQDELSRKEEADAKLKEVCEKIKVSAANAFTLWGMPMTRKEARKIRASAEHVFKQQEDSVKVVCFLLSALDGIKDKVKGKKAIAITSLISSLMELNDIIMAWRADLKALPTSEDAASIAATIEEMVWA